MPTTKAIYERFALTDTGDVIPGAEYTVVNENTGTNLTIYSSREGASKSPPYFADGSGLIQFWVDAGTTFRVAVTGPTGTFTSRYNQGLLLVESPTDTTAGRVLTTGAFGNGPTKPVVTDLDDAPAGDSVCAPTAANLPTTVTFTGGVGIFTFYSTGFSANSFQRVTGRQAGDNRLRIFERQFVATTWIDWQELYHTGNLIYAQNTSGGTVDSNQTLAGSDLTPAQSGTWRNVSGNTLANGDYGLWMVV